MVVNRQHHQRGLCHNPPNLAAVEGFVVQVAIAVHVMMHEFHYLQADVQGCQQGGQAAAASQQSSAL